MCVSVLQYQHPYVMSETASTCEHELVSKSLTIATFPLLLLMRRQSQSLTNGLLDAGEENDSTSGNMLSHHDSNSVDSLNSGRTLSANPMSTEGVPRIIVISPTSEGSIIRHDSVCLDESSGTTENNVLSA